MRTPYPHPNSTNANSQTGFNVPYTMTSRTRIPNEGFPSNFLVTYKSYYLLKKKKKVYQP